MLAFLQEDIEAAKKDWELNRLKQQREEEERRAAMEDDDMLYTYSKEDGMNQVQKKKMLEASTKKKKVLLASRKSVRPPKPKTFDSESEEECVDKPVRKRGRPKGVKNKHNLTSAESPNTFIVKSRRSTEAVTLRHKPGSQTYIVTPANTFDSRHATRQSLSQHQSDVSDVDVEGVHRRSSRNNSRSVSPMKLSR